MSKTVSFVYAGSGSVRLDNLLLAEIQSLEPALGVTRSQVKRWIEAGHVRVDGEAALKSGTAVKPGSTVELNLPNRPQESLQPFEFELPVLHEDDQLIVINKPPGLSMHPGAGNQNSTLLNALVTRCGLGRLGASEFPNQFRLGIVHRLDKNTSGVVVVAKTSAAHARLSAQFEKRSIGRIYECLVMVTPRARREVQMSDHGRIETQIGRHPAKRTLMAVLETGGRRAVTNWKRIETFPYACRLEVRLETGRTHQIRVHLAHLGSPILGDPEYGDFSALPAKLRGVCAAFGRQALHARTLIFDHPGTQERLTFEAPLPPDFENLVCTFRNWDAS